MIVKDECRTQPLSKDEAKLQQTNAAAREKAAEKRGRF